MENGVGLRQVSNLCLNLLKDGTEEDLLACSTEEVSVEVSKADPLEGVSSV